MATDAPMAAIGSYDSVLPFQAIGIETVVITSENYGDVKNIVTSYSGAGYAILFMEESLFADYSDFAEKINELEKISIIPIPNQARSLNIGTDMIIKSTKRAIGMDIFNINK